jgi:hypothetical protein
MFSLCTRADRTLLRRLVRIRCEAVRTRDFCLVGTSLWDLTSHGAFLATSTPLEPDDELVVAFAWQGVYVDAVGRVVRRSVGRRERDLAGVGLSWTVIDPIDQALLDGALLGVPPPAPRRPMKPDYAATVVQVAHA